ncbi:MAG: sensor histidine kinase [Ruminiclostridium sp.]|nr:sensor histidine kinase [Ruminiclostridium sp.]
MKIRTKPWAKAVACILFVLSITAILVTIQPVAELIWDGAYQSGGKESALENKEENLAMDLTHQLTDIYVNERTGPNPSTYSLEELIGDPNFFFTIKDPQGKTIEASSELGDYCERYEYRTTVSYYGEEHTFEKSYPTLEERQDVIHDMRNTYGSENIESLDTWEEVGDDGDMTFYLYVTYTEDEISEDLVFTGFLRTPLIQDHGSYVYQQLHETANLHATKDLYLIALVAGAIGAILSLLFLTWSAGRVEDYDGIALNKLDTHLPLELLQAIGFGASMVGLAIMYENILIGETLIFALFLLLTLAAAAVGLTMYLSLIRRIKAKTLFECVLVRKLARPLRWCWGKVKKAGGKLRRLLSDLAGKLPLYWKVGVGFLGLCLVEFFTILVLWVSAFEIGLVLWLMVKIVEGLFLVWVVVAMRELQHGAWQLGQGNLDYQIPLNTLRGDFKSHGEQLNSMRSAIQAAVEDQMKSERMKTELITNVSHDIKTPLTSIVNYVDLLKKQEMPTQEAKEYLEVLDRQSAKLKKLTEDLVEAAKATTGNTTVNFQRTDVNVLLTQSAGEYQEKLQSKALQLMLTPAPGNPAISADGRLLWRIFENLLSNIYKYALPGTRVYLTCTEEEDKVSITFRNISENPLNITADELMERFVRGDTSRHTEGSGLGLSIAKSLTELQYGSFDIAIDGDLFKATLTFPKIP